MDVDGILPLIAFYGSFALVDEPAPDNAVDALAKVMDSSPAAPSSRLKVGQEFIKRDFQDAARSTLLPVARGAFETPEQPAAAALLPKARAKPGS
jgi:hypothetical protein